MKLRIGVIGCGTVAGYGHIPGILDTPELELVAISDLNAERLQELQSKHGIESVYTDYNNLLSRDDIDAITVATPLPWHYPIVMAAAKAGKHVFCEKPIADTPEKGFEMVKAMSDAGKLLTINFENRVTEPFPEMKRLLDQGEIGNLKVMRFVYNWAGGRWAGDARYKMLMIDGKGPIVDCGVHHFDLARWFSGSEFAEIHATGTNVEDYPHPDHVISTNKMDNGIIALIEGGWAYTHNTAEHHTFYQVELIGDLGLMGYFYRSTGEPENSLTKELYVYSPNGYTRKDLTSSDKNFIRMYTLFAESIKAGKLTGLPSGNDGCKALEAAERALNEAEK